MIQFSILILMFVVWEKIGFYLVAAFHEYDLSLADVLFESIGHDSSCESDKVF